MPEDPIRYDIYANVGSDGRELAKQWFRDNTDKSNHDMLIDLNAAITQNTKLLLIGSLDYKNAIEYDSNAPGFMIDVQIYQEGYGPNDDSSDYHSICDMHKIHYFGILGCPVCEGFSS